MGPHRFHVLAGRCRSWSRAVANRSAGARMAAVGGLQAGLEEGEGVCNHSRTGQAPEARRAHHRWTLSQEDGRIGRRLTTGRIGGSGGSTHIAC